MTPSTEPPAAGSAAASAWARGRPVSYTHLSYLYGRTDEQLTTASSQVSRFVVRAEQRGFAVTPATIDSRVSPDLYVELIDARGAVTVSRPSGTRDQQDPPPDLPKTLPEQPDPRSALPKPNQAYHPDSASINVGSGGGHCLLYTSRCV